MDALAGYDSEGSESNDSAFTEKPRPFPSQKQPRENLPQYTREGQKAAASSSGLEAEMSDLQQDPELKPCLGEPSTPSEAGRDKSIRPFLLDQWPLQETAFSRRGTWFTGQSSSEVVSRLGERQTQGQEGLAQVTKQETTEITFKVTSQRGTEAFQVTISRQEAFIIKITLSSQIKIRVKEAFKIKIQKVTVALTICMQEVKISKEASFEVTHTQERSSEVTPSPEKVPYIHVYTMFVFSPHRGMRGRGRGRGRRRSPGHRDRSRSSSGSASPTGDPALDAQDALRRRLERAKKKQQEKAEREKAEMEAKLESGEAAAGAPPSIAGVNPLLAGQQVTPQEAVCAAARAMQMKVAAETGIQVPSYYNPTAVNPMKYAEQMQKRKLLWAGKKEKKEGDAPAGTVWDKTKFHDEATQAKFRRLMGIHGEASGSGASHGPAEGPDIQQEQEKLFRSLEAQYEFARGTTHTQKGVGLGFSSARQPGPTL
uniref:Arginine/serine-rich coiled-coil protein 2 n=1 Tax=Branchiostoma floridae TaxID=7739 RepID=C3YDI4_BRAFL|eukprot:XP_002605785.1 hypothetical protein BRAFLDRAFT_78056 [Branchiostoma floridae]